MSISLTRRRVFLGSFLSSSVSVLRVSRTNANQPVEGRRNAGQAEYNLPTGKNFGNKLAGLCYYPQPQALHLSPTQQERVPEMGGLGGGLPVSADSTAPQILSHHAVVGTILIVRQSPSIQLNSPTELRVTKRAVGTHDKDEGVGGNSYFRSHRSCCRIRATQDFRRGLRWMPPCRVLSFSAGTTETKIMTSQCESQTEILLLGRAKE